MTPSELPEMWSDEPWPLEDLTAPAAFAPTNWSDTHAEPPQVAHLAHEALDIMDRTDCSYEQALVRAQREAELAHHVELLAEWAAEVVAAWQSAMERIVEVFSADIAPLLERFRDFAAAHDEPSPAQPSCPRHGLLAKGGFCRRCAARGNR